MLEIKFKAYVYELEDIYEVTSINFLSGSVHIECRQQYKPLCMYDEESLKLLQYTNYMDKDWREIYEGDILRFQHYRYSNDTWILKKNGSTYLVVERHLDWFYCIDSSSRRHKLSQRHVEYERVGNIFHTPELIPNRKDNSVEVEEQSTEKEMEVIYL